MQMSKTTIYILITLLTLCVIILIGILILGLTNHQNKLDFFNINIHSKLVIEQHYDPSEITHINTELLSQDIIVQKSQDTQIHIRVYDKDNSNISLNLEEQVLSIKQKKKFSFFNISFSHHRIEIDIPETYLPILELKTVSGNIEIITDPIDIKATTTSGDIKADTLKNAELTTVSGEIKIHTVENLIGKTVSGDITIIEGNIENITTTSGDIEITTARIKQNASIKTVSGDVEITQLENTYINPKTTSGSVRINNNDRKSEYELKIQTVSGDIKIN